MARTILVFALALAFCVAVASAHTTKQQDQIKNDIKDCLPDTSGKPELQKCQQEGTNAINKNEARDKIYQKVLDCMKEKGFATNVESSKSCFNTKSKTPLPK